MSHESEPKRPGLLPSRSYAGGAETERAWSRAPWSESAEALAKAYAQAFPRQSYWVEPVPWLEPRPRSNS
jgi:hypothetical protein